MKKNLFKNHKFLYILGSVLLVVFLLLLICVVCCSFLLGEILDENSWLGILFVIIILISAVGCFFATYLLKKANYLKVNEIADEEAEKMIEENKDKMDAE